MAAFLVIFFVLVAFTFQRVRTVAWIIAACVAVIMIPGLFEDPGAAWALILVGVPFVWLICLAVRLIAQKEQRQRENEDKIQNNIARVCAQKQAEKTFGKFRPRG